MGGLGAEPCRGTSSATAGTPWTTTPLREVWRGRSEEDAEEDEDEDEDKPVASSLQCERGANGSRGDETKGDGGGDGDDDERKRRATKRGEQERRGEEGSRVR